MIKIHLPMGQWGTQDNTGDSAASLPLSLHQYCYLLYFFNRAKPCQPFGHLVTRFAECPLKKIEGICILVAICKAPAQREGC